MRPYLAVNTEADRPDTPYLVVVLGWDAEKGARIQYVSPRVVFNGGKSFYNPVDCLTNISDFGCVASLTDNGLLKVEQVRESKAKYKDGTPRNWQPSGLCSKIRPRLKGIVERCVAESQMHEIMIAQKVTE